MDKQRHRYASVEEVAEYTHVNPATIRRMVSAGDIPAVRFGKRLIRIDLDDVDNYMRRIPTVKDF